MKKAILSLIAIALIVLPTSSAQAQFPLAQIYPIPAVVYQKSSGTATSIQWSALANFATSTIKLTLNSGSGTPNSNSPKSKLFVMTNQTDRHGDTATIVATYSHALTSDCMIDVAYLTPGSSNSENETDYNRAFINQSISGTGTSSITFTGGSGYNFLGAGVVISPASGTYCEGTIDITSITLNGNETFSTINVPMTSGGSSSSGGGGSTTIDLSRLETILGVLAGTLLVIMAIYTWKR